MAILQSFRPSLDGSLCNAACWFLHNGISFNTFSPSPQTSDPNALHGKVTYSIHKLTQCLLWHMPDTMDYSWYEEICDWLLSCPYKWAALLKGGIVQQITIHSLQFPADLELLITQGPSEDIFSQGHTMELDGRWLFHNTPWMMKRTSFMEYMNWKPVCYLLFWLVNFQTVLSCSVTLAWLGLFQ